MDQSDASQHVLLVLLVETLLVREVGYLPVYLALQDEVLGIDSVSQVSEEVDLVPRGHGLDQVEEQVVLEEEV